MWPDRRICGAETSAASSMIFLPCRKRSPSRSPSTCACTCGDGRLLYLFSSVWSTACQGGVSEGESRGVESRRDGAIPFRRASGGGIDQLVLRLGLGYRGAVFPPRRRSQSPFGARTLRAQSLALGAAKTARGHSGSGLRPGAGSALAAHEFQRGISQLLCWEQRSSHRAV